MNNNTIHAPFVLDVLVMLLFSSTGAADKPYTVEDAVSYNELDYLLVSLAARYSYITRMYFCKPFHVDY